MAVAKVRSHGSINSVKPEKGDTLDSIIRQAIGKEPFISFSRADDSPVQLMQLLHAMDQPGSSKAYSNSKVDDVIRGKEHPVELCNGLNTEQSKFIESDRLIKDNGSIANGVNSTSEQIQTLKIPEAVVALAQAAAKANCEPEKYLHGWPLLSPSKVQLQKCKKCSREFCSAINYRRHLRVHRRSLKINKDSARNKEFLGSFWDKLSVDEAKEILSLDNITIEDVAGSSVIRALTLWIKKPGLSSLPQSYVKAGITLLDVIQARTSSLPMSSQELFQVLDDASEKTFLCSGTAVSLQKFIFDGETGKMALEMRNLVACLSFLLEQKLVKAWLADKDAEALRCHQLLMEEEEAAQRRQAELLERRRMKKLRQREQKAKEIDKANDEFSSSYTAENTSGPLETLDSRDVYDECTPEASLSEDNKSLMPTGSDPDEETNLGLHLYSGEAVEETDQQEKQLESGSQLPLSDHLPLCKQVKALRHGLYNNQIFTTKSSVLMKYRNKDIAHMVWTPKAKHESGNQPSHEADQTDKEQLDGSTNSEVLIGSISVALVHNNGNCHESVSPLTSSDDEMLVKPEVVLKSLEPSQGKQWIPVIRNEDGVSKLSTANSIEKMEDRLDGSSAATANQSPQHGHLECDEIRVDDGELCKDLLMFPRIADSPAPFVFSNAMADAFLSQRWKDVTSGDHVELALLPENDGGDICSSTTQLSPSNDSLSNSTLGEKRMVSGEPNIGSASGSSNSTFKRKLEKNCKLKYVPKHRNDNVGK